VREVRNILLSPSRIMQISNGVKKLILIIIFTSFFLFFGQVFAQTEKPRFTLCPERYIAGEETLYLEGTALPGTEVIISLQEGEKEIKRWQILSNEKGEWSFSTRELINSGRYYLAVKEKGEGNDFADRRLIEISLSGFSLPVPSFFETWAGKGPYPIAFRNLVLVLALILAAVAMAVLYFMGRTWQIKRILRKETQEARTTLLSSFESLNKEIEEQIKSFDFQPGFSAREREVYEELKKSLIAARDSIEKEIRDIERVLGRS